MAHVSAIGEYSRRKLLRPGWAVRLLAGAAEADGLVDEVGLEGGALEGADVVGGGAPGAAADDPLAGCLGCVAAVQRVEGVGLLEALGPFGDVAGQVERAGGAGAGGET